MNPTQMTKTDVLTELLPGPGGWICLAVTLAAICWLLVRVRAYWRDDADGDASRSEILSQFQESRREGVLTEEEYRLIRSRLARPASPVTGTERNRSVPRTVEALQRRADSTE